MKRDGFAFCTAVILGFVFCLPVYGEQMEINPFVSIKQEYNDNILFSSDNEENDFITTLSGGLKVINKTERADASAEARLERLFYWDNNELDDLDKLIKGRIHYKSTERLGLGGAASYTEDSRRDRDTDTTGLVVSGDRKRYAVGLSADYMLSEISKGEVRVDYGMTDTEGINTDEDDTDFSIGFTYTKNLSGTFVNTVGMINILYARYSAEEDITSFGGGLTREVSLNNTTDVLQVSIGFSRQLTELYSYFFQAGVSYSETMEGLEQSYYVTNTGALFASTTEPDEDSSTFGGVLAAGLNYDGEYWDADLSVSHSLSGAASTNGAVEQSRITGNLKRRVTENFTLTFYAGLFLNKNEREKQDDTDKLTFNLQPGFSYHFNDDFFLKGIYRYTTVDDRENNSNSERNMVYLELTKEFGL